VWVIEEGQHIRSPALVSKDLSLEDTKLHGPIRAAGREVLASLLCLLLSDIEIAV
jgi:hypothetical protein